ncbi:MAG TPA: hypothetical protein VEH86_06115 [Candidatus Acidoferrum sp.]|nr:hypothetical protein [Candidatus Acidoferrum sp.]
MPNLSKILAERIKSTDLQSLLLEVYRERAKNRNLNSVFSDYASNSFTRPSRCDPSRLLEWDRIAFSHLPEGFQAIELSPVLPLGSVTRLTSISQDWVLTTIRNVEVVADPTNALALECALRRQKLAKSKQTVSAAVQLACSQRLIRTQRFRGPDAQQHFRLFSLCSAGRDKGNLRFEIDEMTKHIEFYLRCLRHFLGPSIPLRTALVDLLPESHDDTVFRPTIEKLREKFEDVKITLETSKALKTDYYRHFRFHVYANPPKDHEMELVDGGDTDWTQKLLSNAKERLVTSGIGIERLCYGSMSDYSHGG